MKKYILFIVLMCLFFIGCTDADIEYTYMLTKDCEVTFDDELTIEWIEDGVFVVSHKFPWDANSMILEMKTGEIILIDTPYENHATEKVISWIRENTSEDTVITAINTGYHFDNLGGNEYLASQGIEIVGTSKTVKMMESSGEDARNIFIEWLQGDENKKYRDVYTDLAYVFPTTVINMEIGQQFIIEVADEEIILYYPDVSHSPDNIVVYVPDKMLLFGGCMVKAANAQDLGNTADADIEGWGRSIDKIINKYPSDIVMYVVPGHGDVGDYGLLAKTRTLIDKEFIK